MTQTERTGPQQKGRPVHSPLASLVELPWYDRTAWWESPAASYSRGLLDGQRMERERREREDEAAWRTAVRMCVRVIEAADRREAFDRGEVTS